MSKIEELLSRLFSGPEKEFLQEETNELFASLILSKLKEVLETDFEAFIAMLQAGDTDKAKGLLVSRQADMGVVVKEVVSTMGDRLAHNISREIDARTERDS